MGHGGRLGLVRGANGAGGDVDTRRSFGREFDGGAVVGGVASLSWVNANWRGGVVGVIRF